MPLPRLAILVSGRGSNLRALLDAELPARVVGVFSSRPDAPALHIASARGVPTASQAVQDHASRAAFDEALLQQLDAWEADVIALAGYMRILTEPVLARFPERIVNIHPSLLPAFPGLHPHRQALERGVAWSGATVHLVEPGDVDGGRILAQEPVRVHPEDDEAALAARILEVEHRLYPAALRDFLAAFAA